MRTPVFICPWEEHDRSDGLNRYQKLVTLLTGPMSDQIHSNQNDTLVMIRNVNEFRTWANTRVQGNQYPVSEITVVFLVHIDQTGINLSLFSILKEMEQCRGCLKDTTGAIIIDGANELHTKNIARKIAFTMSHAGCLLPGHTFAEATGSMMNQQKNAMHRKLSLEEAFYASAKEAVEHALTYEPPKLVSRPSRLLCIHAGNLHNGNTYLFWQKVKKNLPANRMELNEINLRNGEIADCVGCPFEVCMHFSEQKSCFYGGVIVEQVYPAVMESDGIVILCPNYNDSVSANIMAFINRLTALYRTVNLDHKFLFSIIVSGYSGSDILAEQLISSLHFNKGFILPANGICMYTANDPGEILKYKELDQDARRYAALICDALQIE